MDVHREVDLSSTTFKSIALFSYLRPSIDSMHIKELSILHSHQVYVNFVLVVDNDFVGVEVEFKWTYTHLE